MPAATISIMVIESHPLMRAALCAAIADEPGLTIVAVAADVADIMQAAKLLQPDIVLMALGKPGTDEMKALQLLRKKLPAASILTLTNDEAPEQKQAALDHGAQATLAQNAPRSELLGALRLLSHTRH